MYREQQMRALLAERDRDGLTFGELSRRSGVPAGTLASWAFKLRRKDSAKSKVGFVELKLAEVSTAPRARVEIVTRTERRVLVDLDANPEHVARLVAALERC
jgi:hypothetical protein